MAQTANTNRIRVEGDIRQQGMAASVVVFQGALIMRNAAGFLTKGATATGSVGVGVALEAKTGGAQAGDETLKVRLGSYWFKNSASGDLITVAQTGDICWIVDDETVAKTDGTASRSPAGFVEDVHATKGVLVRFDETLARLYVEGIANPA